MYFKDVLIKDAASILKINFSSAKTILRVFKKERRFERKNKEQKTKKKLGCKFQFVVEKNIEKQKVVDQHGSNFFNKIF